MPSIFSAADILLPDFSAVDARRYACIACDQFTSEPAFWEAVEQAVGDAPSTLHLILPEIYLGQDDDVRIAAIHNAMKAYRCDLLKTLPHAMIYVERTDSTGQVRRGLVGKIDLEAYDYHAGSHSLVRATEGTVLSRIPPRIRVRRCAELESPHVMLLIDDPENHLFAPLSENAAAMPTVYDTDLLENSGHLTGRLLSRAQQESACGVLGALCPEEGGILFAVGDGNHSLATAKSYYEELKETLGDAALRHPARYALVEVVNLHDEALRFEPIYRLLCGITADELAAKLPVCDEGQDIRMVYTENGEIRERVITLPKTHSLDVGCLQNYLDALLAEDPSLSVDYIHGEDSLLQLCRKERTVGFFLEPMAKSALFPAVEKDGALPRKTFSMGLAKDKRFYMECRAIQ